ncbi:MAG: 3'(2'),5'-bisphosphate nucleotidase CysQ [Cytophagaceae bacterium]
MSLLANDIQQIAKIATEAGKIVLEVYNNPEFNSKVSLKDDRSPLTLADQRSNEIIVNSLKRLFPSIPVVSEEEKEVPYEVRSGYSTFWLVDPLDGTKEFINRNGQFTVNIALVTNGFPVFGVIYAPVFDTLYYSDGSFAYKSEQGNLSKIFAGKGKVDLIAIGSKSHSSAEEDNFLRKYSIKEKVSIGSSLKFCKVAEGQADIYYRHGPTMEWDTAAGQAIVEAAGGIVVDINGDRFKYNKQSLLNSSFICLANNELL